MYYKGNKHFDVIIYKVQVCAKADILKITWGVFFFVSRTSSASLQKSVAKKQKWTTSEETVCRAKKKPQQKQYGDQHYEMHDVWGAIRWIWHKWRRLRWYEWRKCTSFSSFTICVSQMTALVWNVYMKGHFSCNYNAYYDPNNVSDTNSLISVGQTWTLEHQHWL